MSSPLSMLKKTRRAPLSDQCGREKVPFRRNVSQELQASLLDEDDDDSSDPPPPRPCRTPASNAPPATKPKAPLKKAAPPSDFELMSAMMQRVTLLETQVRSQAQELQSKDKKISVLERKLRVQKESETPHDIERRCQLLQIQVHEMESFLNDYGLIWVGDGETTDPTECEGAHGPGRGLSQPGTSSSSRLGDFHMNFDLVQQRVRELNVLAGEGESFVRSTATGAQLAKKDPIQLRLYTNGIVMFDGPFRSYQELSTQQCMKDLMDGYFPSELHERFPDGVPFEVHDRRDEEFIFKPPWEKFPGEGRAVCGKKDEPSSVASFQTPGKKLTTAQFLNQMPKAVVKAGHVIDIRDSLRAALRGSSDAQSSDSVIVVDTAAMQAMKKRPQALGSDRPSSARDVITLKVKSEDGNQTYMLKMCSSETIGHLRQYLDKHRGAGLPGYDIISAYPQCRYKDDRRTLRSCGLTTNAALLLLRKRRH